MSTNSMNNATSKLMSLVVLVLTAALISCGDHSLDEFLGETSSSSLGKSSSSKAKPSSSSGNIVINDKNIEPAADFAKEAFAFLSFPFYLTSWGSSYWLSISDLDWFMEKHEDDENGEAFMSIFNKLYDNRIDYLSNGKFKRYIELLANLIPRKTYIANGWDTMVSQLLVAYEDLATDPDNFSYVYELMETPLSDYYYTSVDYYPYIIDFDFVSNLNAFIIKKDNVDYCCAVGEINKWAVVWAYSFWARRYNEDPDSIAPIQDILVMLQNKYK